MDDIIKTLNTDFKNSNNENIKFSLIQHDQILKPLFVFCMAIQYNNIDIIKHMLNFNYPFLVKETVDIAISCGNLDIIMLLVNYGYAPSKNGVAYAALMGRLDILTFLHNKKYRGTYQTFDYAIAHGNMDIIKYLIANGYGHKNFDTKTDNYHEIVDLLGDYHITVGKIRSDTR